MLFNDACFQKNQLKLDQNCIFKGFSKGNFPIFDRIKRIFWYFDRITGTNLLYKKSVPRGFDRIKRMIGLKGDRITGIIL